MFHTLHDFLNELERQGELHRVTEPISPLLEITEITDRHAKGPAASLSAHAEAFDPDHAHRGGKALLFENIEGCDFPLAINIFGSYRRMELALGVADERGGFAAIAKKIAALANPTPPRSLREMLTKANELLPLLRTPPRMLKGRRAKHAACQEVVKLTEHGEVDLLRLPLIKCWPLDGDPRKVGYDISPEESGTAKGEGRYITFAGMHTIHADDVDDAKPTSHNIGMYRAQLIDETHLAMHWHMHHDGAAHWRSWKRAGKPMPIAICLGGEAVLPYAATAPLPPGLSELLMAGFLNGRGIPMVRAKTVPLRVPANSEIVIEGWVSTECGEIDWTPGSTHAPHHGGTHAPHHGGTDVPHHGGTHAPHHGGTGVPPVTPEEVTTADEGVRGVHTHSSGAHSAGSRPTSADSGIWPPPADTGGTPIPPQSSAPADTGRTPVPPQSSAPQSSHSEVHPALGPGAVFEGPFGDHTGYYSLPDRYPIVTVTAITHRRNPIFPATIVGLPPQEDYYLGKATERIFLPLLQTLIPDIVDYHLPQFGCFHNCAFVQIRKSYPLQARRVMHAIWGAGQMAWTKYIIVVDDAVDVHDEASVWRAVFTHCDFRRDTELVNGPLDILDHAAPRLGAGHKLGIDATPKWPGEEVNGIAVPKHPPHVPSLDDAQRGELERRWRSIPGVANVCAVPIAGGRCAFVSVRKDRAGIGPPLVDQLWEQCGPGIADLVILVDESVDVQNDGQAVLFHWCANSDPGRDAIRSGHRLAFDATAKAPDDERHGQPVRDFPPIIGMSADVKQRVNERAAAFGL